MKSLGELSTGEQVGHQKKTPTEKKGWGPTGIGEPRERKRRGEREGKKVRRDLHGLSFAWNCIEFGIIIKGKNKKNEK